MRNYLRYIIYMKVLLIAALMLGCTTHKTEACEKEPVKIAIVDTGIGYNAASLSAKLCKYGHKDFSIIQKFNPNFMTKDRVPTDTHGHGTNIAGVIEQQMGDTPYCLVIIKYWDETMIGMQSLQASQKAWEYIKNISPDIVNYSGGGGAWDRKEYQELKTYLDNGGILVAAAGNERADLDAPTSAYYPAMYDRRVVVVGNSGQLIIQPRDAYMYVKKMLTKVSGEKFFRLPSPSSNYGTRVTRWELGENVSAYGIQMTGTSQATAIATGKIARQIRKDCVK